jgi:hypothetical protein
MMVMFLGGAGCNVMVSRVAVAAYEEGGVSKVGIKN